VGDQAGGDVAAAVLAAGADEVEVQVGAGGIGVDADSPTGAVGVYERAGFEVEREFVFYNKKF
jgi:ribosomal protein S18 acetylase RimI-like enzyme